MTRRAWWGEYPVGAGAPARWRIGALTLWAERRPPEWLITHRSTGDPTDVTVEVEARSRKAPPENGVERARYALGAGEGSLRLAPCLPDRPVVTRPAIPLFVAPAERARLFVSVPLWVRLSVGSAVLCEIPIHRASDTWFGPNTRQGEPAYAGRTSARTAAEEIPPRPHRAVVTVELENRTGEMVPVERLNLPVPLLPVFAAADATLWTPVLGFRIEGNGEGESQIRVEIGKRPPPEVPGPEPVAPAREKTDRNLLTRALSALIG